MEGKVAGRDVNFDGIYAAYFTGVSGNSFGMFVFKDHLICGADAGGGIYDGNFNVSDDGKFVEGNVTFHMGIGESSITGVTAENEPINLDVPIKLPVHIDSSETHRIETPLGPINANFRKIRSI